MRTLRYLLAIVAILALTVTPSQAQSVGTTFQVLVYRDLDGKPGFSYRYDSCAANVDVRISFKPDNSPLTLFADVTTPNVNGVVGNYSAWTVCSTTPVTFYGAGTVTFADIDPAFTTTTSGPTWWAANSGTAPFVTRLKVLYESGE